MALFLMVDVTMLAGSSMTALNGLLVLAYAVVFILALSPIVSVGRLRRADPLAGLPYFFLSLHLVPRSPEACRSVHRASFSRSARSCTRIV